MIRANIHEIKANLSRYLERVEAGEVVVICKRNVPIAEIRAISRRSGRRRPIGRARGRIEVPASFFGPLPDDILAAFEGGEIDE